MRWYGFISLYQTVYPYYIIAALHVSRVSTSAVFRILLHKRVRNLRRAPCWVPPVVHDMLAKIFWTDIGGILML
jgi:hypothetical protein